MNKSGIQLAVFMSWVRRRSSPGAAAMCMAWVDRVRKEMVSIFSRVIAARRSGGAPLSTKHANPHGAFVYKMSNGRAIFSALEGGESIARCSRCSRSPCSERLARRSPRCPP